MQDIFFGILAILAGALLCFGGYFVLRLAIVLWGGFVGFSFGAGLIAAIFDERFLSSVLGWVVGIVCALVFAILSYLYYAIAIVIVTVSIGFALGSSLVVALGVDWNWLAILVGCAFGAVLGIAAVVGNLPMAVLIWLSAFAGSSVLVTGIMLIFGTIDSDQFTTGAFLDNVHGHWGWYVLYLAIAIIGGVAQSRTLRAGESVRDSWS